MLEVLLHWYDAGETYAIALVCVVIPMGFFSLHQFLSKHYEEKPEEKKNAKAG